MISISWVERVEAEGRFVCLHQVGPLLLVAPLFSRDYASHSVLVSGLVRFKLKEIVSGKVVDPLLKPGDRFCFAVNAL